MIEGSTLVLKRNWSMVQSIGTTDYDDDDNANNNKTEKENINVPHSLYNE